MNREDFPPPHFKRWLLQLLLFDPDVGDAVLVARQRAEGRDVSALVERMVVSLPAYRRAEEALRRLEEGAQAHSEPRSRSGGEDR